MRKPYKMKHTNGKKADRSSFPFKAEKSDSPLDFNTEAAGDGAIQGAKMGMALGPWGAVAGAAIGGVAAGWETDAMKAEQKKEEERVAMEKDKSSQLSEMAALGLGPAPEKGEAKGTYGSVDPLNPEENKSIAPKRT